MYIFSTKYLDNKSGFDGEGRAASLPYFSFYNKLVVIEFMHFNGFRLLARKFL